MWSTSSEGPYKPLKSQSLLSLQSIREDAGWSVDGEFRTQHTEESALDERRQALAYLLQSSDSEVRNLLGIVAERKAWILEQALEDVRLAGASPRPNVEREPTPRTHLYSERSLALAPVSEKRSTLASAGPPVAIQASVNLFRESREKDSSVGASQFWSDACTFQFASPVYLVDEDSEEVILDVIRVGPSHNACKVDVCTVSGSAKEGEAFEAMSATLYFEEGEVLKSVHVALIDNARWDTHTEFTAKLLNPVGAVMGEYLSETHVKIIDDDVFPSNKFRDQVHTDDLEPIRNELLSEYIRRNIHDPQILAGTLKMICVGVLDSLFMASKLLVHLYILQFVVRIDFPKGELLLVQDRLGSLYLSMCFLLCFFGLQHWLHYITPTWRVAGLSRRVLQHGILATFLVYNEESRNLVDNGQIVMAMVYDVPNVVNNGYMNLVNLTNAALKLLIILAFQIIVPPLLGKRPTLLGLGPAIVIPCITYIFLRFRSDSQTRTLRDAENKESDLISHVTETVRTCRLISDFGKGTLELDKFLEKIGAYNATVIASLQLGGNNAKFVEWLTIISISLYTIWGGVEVLDGNLDLALYVTNIGVFNAAGAAATEFCHVLLQMQKVTPSLERLVRYINLPTDLPKRKDLERHRRVATSRLASETSHVKGPGFVVDKLPIIISELEFNYPNKPPRSFGGRMEMPQGAVLAIAGRCGHGKSTLLRILAGRNLPRLISLDSLFFIPSHIQVLYVPHTPVFVHGTLYDNLVYGVRTGRDDHDNDRVDHSMDRVVSICERLQLPPVVLNEIISRKTIERDWSHKLSSTQCQALLLARAFIANPELLCLEKPTEQFTPSEADNICNLFKEHVAERGLEVEGEKILFRRPRTVIFSTMRLSCVHIADKAYIVNRDLGVRMMESTEVSEEMLN